MKLIELIWLNVHHLDFLVSETIRTLKQCDVTYLLNFKYILFVSNKGALGNLELSICSSKSWSDYVVHLGSKLLLD
jgi:hypothetical protein